ncbi:MAG: 4Fe-4S dicluster domain-containing protein [Thermodesulfobacteriota bacterium]
MEELLIAYSNLNDFISQLMGEYNVIGPVRKENKFAFEPLESPSDIVIDYQTTILPPSKWIYLNNEALLEFNLHDIKKTKAIVNSKRQVILFAHPCDINGINVMDQILGEAPADLNYLKRRKETVIIGYECLKPCGEKNLCFDKDYHKAAGGFDLLFTDIGKSFYVHVATQVGKEIVSYSSFFKKVSYNDRNDLFNVRIEGAKEFKRVLSGNVDMLSHHLKDSYDDMIWDVMGKKCVSCGACNIVCPTCYCFDVVDEVNMDMDTGCRHRRWDACQLNDFSKVASGENFRRTAAERVRHRVFKKEVYLKKRFGRSGCVGCGRCIYSCIAKISILDIFNQVMVG